MKKSIFVILMLTGIFILIPCFTATAVSNEDRIIFIQTVDGNQILYISNTDGSVLQQIARSKKITTFSGKKHLLYYADHMLYEYDPLLLKSKLLSKFTEEDILLDFISSEPGTPDQALLYASDPLNLVANWYILEFSDGSIRRVDTPVGQGGTTSSDLKSYNADNTAVAIIKQIPFSFRFNLEIQEKSNSGFKTVWSLPKEMTIIPGAPVWSPNSRMAAFYGKKYNDTFEGFYSLYLLNLDTKKLHLIQERVFSRFVYNGIEMQDFIPDWSNDSRYLICQYQPFDVPDESSILKYDTTTGKKYFLNNSKADKKYPAWSPSGQFLSYLSDQKDSYQLYVINPDGENMKRLSLVDGHTEWAKWIEGK